LRARIAAARVRLREDGDILIGDAFVAPRESTALVARLEEAAKVAGAEDWRLDDINIVPVASVNR